MVFDAFNGIKVCSAQRILKKSECMMIWWCQIRRLLWVRQDIPSKVPFLFPSRVIRHWRSERHRSYVGSSVPDCRPETGVDSVTEWCRQPSTEFQTWNRCRFSSGMMSATQYMIQSILNHLNLHFYVNKYKFL